ncbi:MAG: transglutaminase domain-containing protein, partial [Lachnospiraceae bacterium]|nr:transglutaminase domain-containing protein [Lachnospiraceae bacterium]
TSLPVVIVTMVCCLGCMIQLFRVNYGMILLAAGVVLLLAGKEFHGNNIRSLLMVFLEGTVVFCICLAAASLLHTKYTDKFCFERKIKEAEAAIHKNKYHTEITAMPEGNLRNPGIFEKNKSPSLRIKADMPQKLYLRGRIGEIYTGGSWEEFSSTVYQENEELFYWLHQFDFYGQNIIYQAEKLKGEKKSPSKLEIENVSACREQWYLPYALYGSASLRKEGIGDDKTRAEEGCVTLEYLPGSIPEWYGTSLWLAENQKQPEVNEYLKKEESYRDFVYKNNLQLTNTVVGVFENLFKEDRKPEKGLGEILELVQETLEKKLDYDENVVTYNGNQDFIKYTLEQNKRGYSIHYATIATMMLRYLGVPARYVEGYFLSENEAADYQAGEEIILTEAHAHAWTEYYLDGIGWLPFEVTPGYIDEKEWEEAAAVISQGEEATLGKGFLQSSLTYTPPKLPKVETQYPDLRSIFRFETKQILYLFVILLSCLILLAILWVFKRHLKFRAFWKGLENKDNREAVEEIYGYTMMLAERFQISPGELFLEARSINERARFSREKIEDDQRSLVEEFGKRIRQSCRRDGNLIATIKYH